MEGFNNRSDLGRDRVFITSGFATISADPGDDKWIAARNSAFQQAELAAKANLAKAVKQYVTSQRKVATDSVTGLTQAQTDAKTGTTTPGQATQIDVVSTTDSSVIKASLFASGAFVVAEYLGKDQATGRQAVLIGLMTSPKLEKIAESILNPSLKLPEAAPAATLSDQISALDTADPFWLANTNGVRVWTDELGQKIVIGFGHARISSGISQAYKGIAEQAATVAIQRFVGEMTTTESESESLFLATSQDGKEESFESNKYKSMVEAKSKTMVLNGIAPLHSWAGEHPEGRVRFYSAAMAWTPSGAAAARAADSSAQSQQQKLNALSDGTPQQTQPGANPAAVLPRSNSGTGAGPSSAPIRGGATSNPTQF